MDNMNDETLLEFGIKLKKDAPKEFTRILEDILNKIDREVRSLDAPTFLNKNAKMKDYNPYIKGYDKAIKLIKAGKSKINFNITLSPAIKDPQDLYNKTSGIILNKGFKSPPKHKSFLKQLMTDESNLYRELDNNCIMILSYQLIKTTSDLGSVIGLRMEFKAKAAENNDSTLKSLNLITESYGIFDSLNMI